MIVEAFSVLQEDPITSLLDVASKEFTVVKPDVFHHLCLLDELDAKASLLKDQIQRLQSDLSIIQSEISDHESELVGIASQTATGFSMGPYRVRYTKGKETVRWDADKLADVLPAPLADLVLTATTSYKADTKLLKTLEEGGKLPADVLECKTIKGAEPRFIFERVKES